MKFAENILKLFYPDVCVFCGKISAEGICAACRSKVSYIEEPRCKRCGKPIRYEEQEYCHDCKAAGFSYEQGKSLWLHKAPVSTSLYQFKYKNRRSFGEVYAEELYRKFARMLRIWGIDLIVPIPIHAKKRRQRGYNQAEIIAKYLGDKTGIPVNVKALKRVRDTKPQKELTGKERKKNLQNAFAQGKGNVRGKRILLIDDIYTTGITIEESAKVLRRHGAQKVYFLTISIGQGF